MDRSSYFSRIIKALKENGLWENTLIIFTSDHGDHMADFSQLGKGTMLESSVRIPLIIKAPGVDRAGRQYSEVVNLIDLYCTFLDYAEVTVNSPTDSRSIRKLLEGDQKWENKTFSSIGSHDGRNGQVMYIKDKYKAVGFIKDGIMKTELYDRTETIHDLHNLASEKQYSDKTAEIQHVMENWIKKFDPEQ